MYTFCFAPQSVDQEVSHHENGPTTTIEEEGAKEVGVLEAKNHPIVRESRNKNLATSDLLYL